MADATHGSKASVEDNYRPQSSYGKVMFLHMSVILSTGGGVSRRPPWAGTPIPQQTATAADGTHPTGMHSYFADDIGFETSGVGPLISLFLTTVDTNYGF